VCQFVVGEEDVLDGSVGVENVGVDLTPDLEREGAQELGVDLCVWQMAARG
jgi:hypothetical protein